MKIINIKVYINEVYVRTIKYSIRSNAASCTVDELTSFVNTCFPSPPYEYTSGVNRFVEFYFAEFRRIHSVANQKSAFPKKCPWGPPLGGGPGQS